MLLMDGVQVVQMLPDGGSRSAVKRTLSVAGFPLYFEFDGEPTEHEKSCCEAVLMSGVNFEAEYAARNSMSVKRLRALGRAVVPCACGEPDCKGWKSVNEKDLN